LNSRTKAHVALLGTNIFFAINFTAVKYLVNNGFIRSFGLNLVRVGITAGLLWILFLFKPVRSVIHKKDYGRFFMCALTGIAINQLLFVKGLSLTYSIHASLLMLTTPILITFIAVWVLKERLNASKVTGLAIGIIGAGVLITARESSGNGNEILLGDIMLILNAMSYAFYFILVRPLMKAYEPITVIRMIFTIGFFLILPFCFKEFTEVPWQLFTFREYLILGLVIFCGTFLAYILNVYGIKILGASIAGAYIYSQPVFAALIAIIFLGEVLSVYKIIAAVLIFAGVYLANKTNTND